MASKLVPTRSLNIFPLHLVFTSLGYTGQVTAVPNLPARYSYVLVGNFNRKVQAKAYQAWCIRVMGCTDASRRQLLIQSVLKIGV